MSRALKAHGSGGENSVHSDGMPIVDPHAIPETADACREYLAAADEAWDGGRADEAWDLYYAAFNSAVSDHAQTAHAAYRLALIAINRGDHEAAYNFADYAGDQGKDLLKSLRNAAPESAPPDPARVPATMEELEEYWKLAAAALDSSDWNAVVGWYGIMAQSPVATPDQMARCSLAVARGMHQQGDDAGARRWLDAAIPNLNGSPEEMASAQELVGILGSDGPANPATPAEQQLADGIDDYRIGDGANARKKLEAALHVSGATDEVKGRAEFYIGSMDLQAHQYAEARDRLERAVSLAPEPEKGWASRLLADHWQEE